MTSHVLALVGILIVSILIALVLVRVVNTYRAGRDIEACVKHALFLMLVRLDRDLACSEPKDKLIVQAVFSLLTESEVRDDAVRQLMLGNQERVLKVADQVLATDTDLRTLAVRTRDFLYAGRWAHGNQTAAEGLLNNPFLARYQNERSLAPAEYFRLVSELSDRWLREPASNTPDCEIRDEDIPS